MVIDWETTGLDPFSDHIVGVGIADTQHPHGVYFCMKTKTAHHYELMRRISRRPKIAHNFTFEMMMEEMWWRKNSIKSHTPLSRSNYRYCTQGLLNQFEGDALKRGLKDLQIALLGWDSRGDVELDQWLVDNGYGTKGKANKGEMHRAPTSILGKYCGLDAQSTLAIYTAVMRPALDRFEEQGMYHSREYMHLGELVVEQRLRGMKMDVDGLDYYLRNLEWMIETLQYEFVYYTPAAKYIKEYNDSIIEDYLQREPPKHTKTGAISVRWQKWNDKIEHMRSTNHFNTNSKLQLAWLFYDRLYKTKAYEEKTRYNDTIKKLDIYLEDEVVTINRTPSGLRPVDKEILPRLGEAGQVLLEYNKLVKELGYVSAMRQSLVDGYHHPQLRLSGTKTDRCAGGGGVNIQQQPKSYDYMKCFTHRKSMKLLQLDIDALEAVVLAELSECKSYMKLYGPDAPKGNDVYLFVGSGLGEFARPILDAGYDPDNPDPDTVQKVKKMHKGLRAIFKKFHLSGQYGAGAGRIYADLRMQGVDVTLDQCKEMHTNYWKLFEDVVKFTERLRDERTATGGYFLDGFGCPVSVAYIVSKKGSDMYEKDILNRCIQNTGHKILVKYLYHLGQLRKESDVKIYPVLADFHDETVWEYHEQDEEAVKELFRRAWERTNNEIGGLIPLTGEPEVCTSWAEFKCETTRGVL